MSYKAQLVVRARTKEGTSIIETVKAMANEQDKTYSEMAVELIGRGLNGNPATDKSSAPIDDEKETKTKKASEKEVEPVVVVDEVKKRPKKKAPPNPRAPLPAEEAGPAVDPTLPPKEILRHYLDRRKEMGERAAARILVDFFGVASPGPGGNLKKLLQEEFTVDDYEALMAPIKETEEYSTYTDRALFGEPSPYSQVN